MPKNPNKVTKNDNINYKKLSIISILVMFSTIISYFLFDRYITNIAIHFNDTIKSIFGVITWLGSVYIILPLILILTYEFYSLKSHHKENSANCALFVGLSIIISWFITFAIKSILARYRPEMLINQNLYGLSFFSFDDLLNSFPSGHTTSMFALVMSLSYLFPKYKYLFISGAILVGLSRIILLKHYLSDVIFGAFIAIITTYLLKEKYFCGKICFK